ncbi:MAG: hypothetical protein ABIA37_02275, partial [Candidatus Woesearchaeota archaeon]
MLEKISQEVRKIINSFPEKDELLFNNKLIEINPENFQKIEGHKEKKTIAFIDGGQAEIISTGNFCLSFIRVFAQVFAGDKKTEAHNQEFYLFTRAEMIEGDLIYTSKIFGDQLLAEEDLLIDSNDPTVKNGTERAPISRIANMARRFAELSLAKKIKADFIVLDGTLAPTFKNEEKFLSQLTGNVCALAKSSSLFTVSGNSPTVLLDQLSPSGCWSYAIEGSSYFVKLHPQAKHIFRFEGNELVLSCLIGNSQDPLFLGYPYGLIFADKFARISNQEKNSLRSSF